MKSLKSIFEPIAEDLSVDLRAVTDIAIDTDQTLVYSRYKDAAIGYVADPIIAGFAKDLIENQERLGVNVTIISGSPHEAEINLRRAGLQALLVKPVENRMSYFSDINKSQRKCVVIDDDYLLASLGHGNVNPHSTKVRDYISRGEYRESQPAP